MAVTSIKKKPVKKSSSADVHGKLLELRTSLCESMIERDDEIDIVLTAMLAGENPLFIGPPGCGKSMLAEGALAILSGDIIPFNWVLTKFTEPNEIFGPYSLKSLKEDIFKRVPVRKLPNAHIAFLDEIFKSSSAVLNTLLRILNEHTFDDGVKEILCPLIMCVAAGNEFPNDSNGGQELGAVFDRFLLRKKVRPIATTEGKRRLMWGDFKPIDLQEHEKLSLHEIEKAHEEVNNMDWEPDTQIVVEDIISTLNASGIFPGDRRVYKSIKVVQAYAYLRGKEKVENDDLAILSHCLWDDPVGQPEKTEKIVMERSSPEVFRLNEYLGSVAQIVQSGNQVILNTGSNEEERTRKVIESISKLKETQKKVEYCQESTLKKFALRTISTEIRRFNNFIVGHNDETDGE